jgi:hypothetical protein
MNCTTCHRPIAPGTALIRSRSFVAVAFHPACYHPAPVRAA